MIKRVFLIVLDSLGIGDAPDAAAFGDEGSNTLKSISLFPGFSAPNLQKAGLFNLVDYYDGSSAPLASYARMREKSAGKDTTIGHWEIAGILSPSPLPTYPNGFPKEVLDEFTEKTGYGVLCNKPYSGTQIIADYGKEHMQSKKLIVYTSADSVFQIAAHEDVVPLEELYHVCKIAREILKGKHGVGRVIARPFTTEGEKFVRTTNRHDFSLEPPKKNMLDYLYEDKKDVISVGKISDIFCGKSITESHPTHSNREGMDTILSLLKKDFTGLCFINLVDFDMLYGHRNDVAGYQKALMEFDIFLPTLLENMANTDALIITADHGCDPATPSTDHSRECTPMLIMGGEIKQGVSLGIRNCFCDIGKTILDLFHIENNLPGTSFCREVTEI